MKYPIFPLNVFLLPGEVVALHIFEPRYKELLEDTLDTKMPFGIFYQNKDNKHGLGTMVELDQVQKKYAGGEADITVEASYLFRLDSFEEQMETKLYGGGNVTRIPDPGTMEMEDQTLEELTSLIRKQHPDQVVEIPDEVHEITNLLQLESKDKLELAVLGDGDLINKFLRSHIQLKFAILEQEEQNGFTFHLN